MVFRQRLHVEGVQRGAGDGPALQRVHQRGLVHDGAARDVDQIGRRFHQGQFVGPHQSPGTLAKHQVDRQDVRIAEQRVLVHQRGAALAGAFCGEVLAPRDDVHIKGSGDTRHQRADMTQPQQSDGLAPQAHADSGAPLAFPRKPVFQGNLPHDAKNQAPGQLRRPLARAVGAADGDAQVSCRLDVERGVSPPGGDQQAKVGQALQQRALEGSALPHTHYGVEAGQTLSQGILAGQVVAEKSDFGAGGQLRPIGQAFGDALVVVKNGDFHFDSPQYGLGIGARADSIT